ncbi:hypothetical protein BC830DRAFT_1110011 [Chytriomyces sp. MP71]|nr:hypothetical protein BC830DRAFT_1110011 [Chytriomyces sp. MP71]
MQKANLAPLLVPPLINKSDTSVSPLATTPAAKKHGLANQNADFFQQPICLAILMDDLQAVEALLRHPEHKSLPSIRGSLGETILHVAILLKKEAISLWLIEHCGSYRVQIKQPDGGIDHVQLLDVPYGEGLNESGQPFGTRFMGENALHLACKNGMYTVAKALLDRGAKVNAVTTGEEYISLTLESYTHIYSGCTPLHFAATQPRNLELVKLLVERGANLYFKDPYGNNVLHVMAHYGHFNDIYRFILQVNHADIVNKRTTTRLQSDYNNDEMGPAQFGIHLGHTTMIEALKEPLWTLGDEFAQYQVAIDHICPVLNKKNKNAISVLEGIVDRWDDKMIAHPIFRSIVRVKWDLYARRYFLTKFIWSFITVLLFTISVCIDRTGYNFTNMSLPLNISFYFLAAAFAFAIFGIFDVIRSYVRLFRNSDLPPHLRNRSIFSRYFQDFLVFFTLTINDCFDETLLQIGFCACVITIFGIRTANYMNPAIDIVLIPSLEGAGSLLGFVHLLYYARGLRSLGPLILVVVHVITRGLTRWIVMYFTLEVGYAVAFYAQMKNFDYDALIAAGKLDATVDRDWSNISGAIFWTVRFLFSILDLDNMRQHSEDIKNNGFMLFLFLTHQFFVITLLLNVFIAMLVDIWNSVSSHYESQWLLQMAKIVTNTDHSLTNIDRKMVETYFGFHQNPVTLKHIKRQRRMPRIHPGVIASSLASITSTSPSTGRRISEHKAPNRITEELQGSLPSFASVEELITSQEAAKKAGQEVPKVDPRRFFMFLVSRCRLRQLLTFGYNFRTTHRKSCMKVASESMSRLENWWQVSLSMKQMTLWRMSRFF